MKEIIFYLLSGISFLALIFLIVDAYFWWMDRYPRYKIGRNKNFESWSSTIFKKGISWLPKVPAVPISQNHHLLLWDILQGKFVKKSVQAWQTGGLLIGVTEYSPEKSKEVKQKTISKFIDENGNWKESPQNVDYAILAYSFLKNHPNPFFLKPAMDEMINFIKNKLGEDGLILYSDRKNIRYIDTLGLVCPFLALYENVYATNEYKNLAVLQIEKFLEFGLFKNTWIPVHSYESYSGLPIGVYGWGRGVGWLVLGILDTYLELKDGHLKDRLQFVLKNIAEDYLQFQRKDGGFGTFIQDKNTYDSSATSVLAYFYAKCYIIFRDDKYLLASEKSLIKLQSMTRRNGALDYCQGDTVDVGIFSRRFDIMPFAQGMTLRAIKILKK